MRTKFFATIRPGLPTIQFGYSSARLELETRTTTGEALTLTTSDGSADAYTSSIVKNFADDRLKVSGLTVSSPLNVDVLTIRSPNVEFVNGPFGTVNVAAFPNLVQLEIVNSRCNKFLARLPYGLRFDGAQCDGKTLNIQGADGITIYVNNTYAQHVLWPVGATYVNTLVMQNHSITQPQTLTAIPNLRIFNLSYNASADRTKGIGKLDLSYNLQLTTLDLREARINDLVSISGQQVTSLDLIFNDLSRTLSGRAGNPISFVNFVSNNLKLGTVQGFNIGLGADHLEALLDVLISSDPARVRCSFFLAGSQFAGGIYTHYLNTLDNPAGRVCEPLVTYQAQNKLAIVRERGHVITVNDPVFSCTVLDDSSARVDYIGGTKDITWWDVGDSVSSVAKFNGDLFNYGDNPMEVLSGSGKSWVIRSLTNPAYAGQSRGATGLAVLTKA